MKFYLSLSLVLLLTTMSHSAAASAAEPPVAAAADGLPGLQPQPRQWVLSADAWARPRHGDELVREPALREAVAAAAEDGHLLIRYPAGEEGVLWAQELKSWLVALGLPSRRLDTQFGYQRDDTIILLLEPQTENTP